MERLKERKLICTEQYKKRKSVMHNVLGRCNSIISENARIRDDNSSENESRDGFLSFSVGECYTLKLPI
jgi:hypothetical protein